MFLREASGWLRGVVGVRWRCHRSCMGLGVGAFAERAGGELAPYDELVERRERLTRALAALDGGDGTKKRVRWEQIAEYVAQHPGAMPAEIAAALEIPAANAHAHLGRNEGTVFERRVDGWHVIEGWEAQRRSGSDG
jgi:hypothetical protein